MRSTAGAVQLLQGTHGERITQGRSQLRRDSDGRYQHESATPRTVAKWLPNVTVPVCDQCNHGWMSGLEDSAKRILRPFIFSGTTLRLSREDLLTLARWATKSWMAYALLRPAQHNPFTVDEYRMMATSPQPLERSQVWLMHSGAPGAHVAMALESTLLSLGNEPPDFETAQDNLAYGYLAVSTVVLAMQLLPEQAPADMADALAPPVLATPRLARRIWPNLRPQYFPLDAMPDEGIQALVSHPHGLFDALGLPTLGLTRDDAAQVVQEFSAGADPRELRRRWNQPE